jgi:GNAT superfamily N-acetyltransferase
MTLEVHALTPDRWDDLLTLFGPNGAYSNCWCTWWRQTGSEYSAGCGNHGAGNRVLLQRLTDAGLQPGLIGYRDRRPVGWVSVAPLDEFGRILRSPKLKPERGTPTSGVWAVVCFFIPRAERGAGVATELLGAAVEQARAGGATSLEAYPIDTRGERHDSAGLFTGTLSMVTEAGFAEVRRRSTYQPVVALELAAR